MGKSRGNWYYREETKKITFDWVKTNCKFTEREKELLQLVYDRKLVRRDHLEIISPSYRIIEDKNVRRVLICRAIKKMYQKMCLDKVHEPQEMGKGNTPSIISIDKGGSILLGVPHKQRISHTINLVNGKEYITRKLPANYRHINGVNQLEVETILFCERNNYVLVDWKIEQCKTFFHGQEKVSLIPDVIMVLNIGGKMSVFFVEFDSGSENVRYKEPPIIRDKIIKYRRYMTSRLWEEEWWQKYFSKLVFPRLLFVTEDYKRIEFVNNKCKENGVRGYGIYYENYTRALGKIATLVK